VDRGMFSLPVVCLLLLLKLRYNSRFTLVGSTTLSHSTTYSPPFPFVFRAFTCPHSARRPIGSRAMSSPRAFPRALLLPS